LLPDGTIQRGVPFSALGFLRAAGSTSGGRAAGNAATMKAKRENTPTVCAQAALAIVVKPIPATKQAIASLGSRPRASAAGRERAFGTFARASFRRAGRRRRRETQPPGRRRSRRRGRRSGARSG